MTRLRRAYAIALISISLLFLTHTRQVNAYDFQPVPVINTKDVDPTMLKSMYGVWEIQDAKARKRCRVTLKSEATIGGSALAFAPGCEKTFPILKEISGWRLLEGWGIDLIDPLRKPRLRFTTPDERYIALPEIDGIDTIVKK